VLDVLSSRIRYAPAALVVKRTGLVSGAVKGSLQEMLPSVSVVVKTEVLLGSKISISILSVLASPQTEILITSPAAMMSTNYDAEFASFAYPSF